MDNVNETVEAAVKSVWPKLEETLTGLVEDVCEELYEKIEQAQSGL
jgi:hypothetical protein